MTTELPLMTPAFSIVDADLVGAWMLSPEDPEWRGAALNTYMAKRAYEWRTSLSKKQIEDALALALVSPPEAAFRPEFARRMSEGVMVGNVFTAIIAKTRLGIATSLGEEIERVSRMFAHDGNGDSRTWPLGAWIPKLPTSKRHADEAWKTFKPVAHLWAAWIHRDHVAVDSPFPCALEALGDLLGRSEQFLDEGETVRLPHAPEPFGATDPVRISQGLRKALPQLPRLEFDLKAA